MWNGVSNCTLITELCGSLGGRQHTPRQTCRQTDRQEALLSSIVLLLDELVTFATTAAWYDPPVNVVERSGCSPEVVA